MARPLLTVAVVAGVAAALFLATMLLQGALNPWQQLFARTHGADMLVYFQDRTDLSELRSLPGVQAVSPPYQAASATLAQGAQRSPVELRSMTQAPPAMSTPLVVAGTWLRASEPAGAVIEASFAQAVHVGVGDQIVVDGIDGTMTSMRVIGIADTADQGFYPQWTPGLIWVQHGLLTKVEPNPSETQEVVGLRLTDNSAVATGQVVQTIWNLYNGPDQNSSSAVERYSTWQQVQNSMASNDRLLGLLLALFGIIALVAAPCAIANVTAGRVLVQRQDIAMLKALGFTPGQVVRMLVAEQTALGAAGTVLGLAAARIVTSPEFVRPPDGTPVGLAPLSGSWVAVIGVGTVLTVALATIVPAWYAGRVSPVAAVQPSPPRGHLSRMARLGLLVRLPAPLVLGAETPDPAAARGPDRVRPGRPHGHDHDRADLLVDRGRVHRATGPDRPGRGRHGEPGRPGQQAGRDPDQSGPSSPGVLPGHVARHAAAGRQRHLHCSRHGLPRRPYPFQVVQGRMFHAPNEAVAGQGFLDLMHIGVGAVDPPTSRACR